MSFTGPFGPVEMEEFAKGGAQSNLYSPGMLQSLGLLPPQTNFDAASGSPQSPTTGPMTFQQHMRDRYPIAASVLKLFS